MKQPFAYFAQIESILSSSDIFTELQENNLYYYYFQKNNLYYIFIYGEIYIYNDLDFFLSYLTIIQELNRKKRKIRSLRGFFLYTLEIIGDKQNFQVLESNVGPQFWERVDDTIRQNKRNGLVNFLFPNRGLFQSNSTIDLETKYSELADELKKIQQLIAIEKPILGNTLQSTEKASKTRINDVLQDTMNNDSLIDQKYQMEPVFVSPKDLNENEKTQIIMTGFQLNTDRLITLKDYYEGQVNTNSLAKIRGYSIKYESIRRDQVYRKLKKAFHHH